MNSSDLIQTDDRAANTDFHLVGVGFPGHFLMVRYLPDKSCRHLCTVKIPLPCPYSSFFLDKYLEYTDANHDIVKLGSLD